jgi:hypothetical protein
MTRLLFLDTLAINRSPAAEYICRHDTRFEIAPAF